VSVLEKLLCSVEGVGHADVVVVNVTVVTLKDDATGAACADELVDESEGAAGASGEEISTVRNGEVLAWFPEGYRFGVGKEKTGD